MRKIILAALMSVLYIGAVSGQKTQGPYTIRVYNSTGNCLPQGSMLTSNGQLQPNTVYFVSVRSNASPAAIKIDNVDGFETGLYGWCPFQLRPDPTSAAGDTYSGNNWTIVFTMRTISGSDFASPVYMRIQQTFNGTTWVNTQHVTFPY
ncbi:MAG: hypothetical protein KF846_08570 [Cyclobacteriaceae bacterium]|nr:hypothetical protein [Cyclobacteriaceae bacterium]